MTDETPLHLTPRPTVDELARSLAAEAISEIDIHDRLRSNYSTFYEDRVADEPYWLTPAFEEEIEEALRSIAVDIDPEYPGLETR